MPFNDCFNRVLANLANVPSKNIKNAKLTKEESLRVSKALKFIKNYPHEFEIVDVPRGATISSIENIYKDHQINRYSDFTLIPNKNCKVIFKTAEEFNSLSDKIVAKYFFIYSFVNCKTIINRNSFPYSSTTIVYSEYDLEITGKKYFNIQPNKCTLKDIQYENFDEFKFERLYFLQYFSFFTYSLDNSPFEHILNDVKTNNLFKVLKSTDVSMEEIKTVEEILLETYKGMSKDQLEDVDEIVKQLEDETAQFIKPPQESYDFQNIDEVTGVEDLMDILTPQPLHSDSYKHDNEDCNFLEKVTFTEVPLTPRVETPLTPRVEESLFDVDLPPTPMVDLHQSLSTSMFTVHELTCNDTHNENLDAFQSLNAYISAFNESLFQS